MKFRLVAFVVLAGALASFVPAATPAPVESKSAPAKPVAPPHPPTPPESPGAAETPRTPGVLNEGRDGALQGINEDITIHEGESHDGDVICIRGHVTIDGHVNGDVTVVAGSLDLRGSVDGDVTGVVSRVEFDPKADVEGDLTNVGGSLQRNGAKVQGQVVNIPLGITMPSWGPRWRSGWGPIGGFLFLWKLFATFLFFVCALLLSALVPDRIRLISEEAPHRLFTAFIFGLIGYMVFVFCELFLTMTIIGLPLVFLLYLVFIVLKWLAMCGIFHQIGHRIGRSFGREMSLLGGILLGFLPFALLRFVPFCVGFSIWFLVEILAFGYLILTRVGTRSGPEALPRPPAPLAPQPAPGTMAT
jgi:hypothetical protein